MPARDPRNGTLTELEGAVLSVIRREGPCTPYRVRQDFLTSRSSMWSGSAGAVYPALRRLADAGLVREKVTEDARNSVLYTLSPAGTAALDRWISDVETATGSGLDPFRCRADLLDGLSKAQRTAVIARMTRSLEEKCTELETLLRSPSPEPRAAELELALHRTRLAWLKKRPGP